MRIDFNISQSEAGKFRTACEVAIRGVGTATKAATIEAIATIASDSLEQVPVDTGTLISSQYFGVSRRSDIKTYRYGAIIGYGSPEGIERAAGLGGIEWLAEPSNPINPKSGLESSTYAATVHEDLEMPHPRGGKAKFLEDPVRNYAAANFARTVTNYWRTALYMLTTTSIGSAYIDRETGRIYKTSNRVKSRAVRSRLEKIQRADTYRTFYSDRYLAGRDIVRRGNNYFKSPSPPRMGPSQGPTK